MTQILILERIKKMGFFSKVGGVLNDVMGVTDTANKSYQNSVKLWNMQNEYNHPKNQIARMAEAGIDINPMTYAVGNGSMSTVASSPGQPQFSGAGINPVTSALSVVNGLKGLERQDAEIENTKALTNQINMLTPQKFAKLGKDIDVIIHNLKYAKDKGLPVGSAESLDRLKAQLLQTIIDRLSPGDSGEHGVEPKEKGKPAVGSNAGDMRRDGIKWWPF